MGIESRIGDKDIPGTGLLKLKSGLPDLLRWYQTHAVPLDVGIGAINAMKGASPFGLQIQHAAVFQIKGQMGGSGIESPNQLALPGLGRLGLAVRSDHSGNSAWIFSVFQCLNQLGQSFALAQNTKVRPQVGHAFAGEDGKTAAAQYDGRPADAVYGIDQLFVFAEKSHGIGNVGGVHIAQGNTDQVRCEGADMIDQIPQLGDVISIQNVNLMSGRQCQRPGSPGLMDKPDRAQSLGWRKSE